MKTLIINVSTNEYRKNHMLSLIEKHECLCDNDFIHDGDLKDISPTIHNKYFTGLLNPLTPAVSCAYKHILSYIHIINNETDVALILEDDIFFSANFCNKLAKILAEIEHRQLSNFLISLEDSNLKYVRGSELKKNVLLYKKKTGRMAGCYLIDKQGAKSIFDEIVKNKCHLPIDWYHNYCSSKDIIDIYWAHPVLATQGSLNGMMPSLIDNKKTGLIKRFLFKISKAYKTLLDSLR